MAVEEHREVRAGLRQTWGVLLIAMAAIALLSLISYKWQDIPVLQRIPNDPARNYFGPAGAWLAFSLLTAFGIGAYLAPFWCAGFGVSLILKPAARYRPKMLWMLLCMTGLLIVLELQQPLWHATCDRLNIGAASGGVLVHALTHGALVKLLSGVGTAITGVILLLVGAVKLAGIRTVIWAYMRLVALVRWAVGRVGVAVEDRRDRKRMIEKEQKQIEKQRARLAQAVRKEEREAAKAAAREEKRTKAGEKMSRRKKERKPAAKWGRSARETAETPVGGPAEAQSRFVLPSVDLLDPLPAAKDRIIKGDVARTGQVLENTLAEFGIETEVTDVQQGPVVTRYELRPAAGVRVERISGLSNNLALALKATSVRVQAPVPGKGVVGVEVPNATSSKVFLREMLEGETWRASKAALPLILGKDVGGNDIVADLTAAPHLLIAGATGSGKTVCINAILLGLLMTRPPEQLRLMLVDPKIVEFSSYNELPHLIVPVVTDPHKVALGLRWAITEMERRYKLFARVGVRNIESYNSRAQISPQDLFDEGEEDAETPATLPYIVIAVDELADLMLVAQADIENCIARLAQLSRAVGIHMILATQRPSVNIITGTIKANFPARIAFQVAQRVDSRTILDANGADKLLGSGDMLFLPPGSNKLLRAQGAMVKDHEVRKVVEYIKSQAGPTYDVEIHERIQSSRSGSGAAGGGGGEDDELLEQAIEIIRETRRASTSSLQRRLRIGYTRAARLMDMLEEQGIVGPPRGSDPREILIDLDGIVAEDMEDDDVEEQEFEDEDA